MILGWSKVTKGEKKSLTKIPKKNLKDLTKWNRKMGGRSFNITSGAFWDTLSLMPWRAFGLSR